MKTVTASTLAYVGIASILLLACSNSDNDEPLFRPAASQVPVTALKATVHRTEGGIPHIIADDWASLGFGTGFAAAEDNVCLIARNLLKYRARLAEFLGPDDGNLNTDLFYQYLIDSGQYDAEVSTELAAMFTGYAAGFNRYLRQTGVDNLPDPVCRGAQWIQPMTVEDLRRIHLTPAFLPNLSQLFLAAAPPADSSGASKAQAGSAPSSPTSDPSQVGANTLAPIEQIQSAQQARSTLNDQELAGLVKDMATARNRGSNGVAIGRDVTTHEGGLLYANPHLDWGTQFRFYPMHQIIPGVSNLLGANTYERAHVGFGTNGDIAWTNTVATSRTSAVYELELVPGNPLAYVFDGAAQAIEQIEVSVKVLGGDGNLSDATHTFYKSRHGLLLGLIFSWDNTKAFALRVADEGDRSQNGAAIAFARAKNVRELKAAASKYQATANVNLIAADSSGEAFYGDVGPVANMTDQQLTDCATATPVAVEFFAPAFEGNTSDCEWNTDADSAAPGLLGASKQPFIFRTDYATNSNDSFWLANPNQPITGIPAVHGDTDTERSLRTRSGLRMVAARIDGSDGLGGNSFDVDSVLDRMLSNQNYAGQILRDDLVTLCTANPSVTLNGTVVDISVACPILAAWDVHSNLDSRGAHLFREVMRAANGGNAENSKLPESLNYTVAFDVSDPLNTPRGLDTNDNPVALQSLASAVQLLNEAGIALDARLGDVQTVTRNGEVIPLHGGEAVEGVFNKMSLAFDGANGYPAVTDSSASWIMATEFTAAGPVVKGILSYSLSANTESPHYADMTKLFSNKQFVDLPFSQEDVEAAALSTLELSEGSDDCVDNGWQNFEVLAFADEAACVSYFDDLYAQRLTDFVSLAP